MLKDRVKVSTNTTGTGVITLGGAESGFQNFDSLGDSGTYYVITNGSNWEVGYGIHSSGSLYRNFVLDSSSGGSLINLSGKSYVFITYPADKAVYLSPDANPSSGDLLFKTELGWLGRPLSSGDIGSALGFIPPSSQNTYTSNSGIVSYLNNFSLGGTGKLSNLLFDTNIVVGGSPPQNNKQKNVILGWDCGISGSLDAVNASENVFIGNNCGKNNLYNLYAIFPQIEYTYNVVIGSSGLYNTSSYCQKNISIGLNSLNGTVPSGATYSNVISIGNGACSRVDNCSDSIYIGQSAGARSFSLESSVGVGSFAGYSSSGIKNIYLGYFAGYSASGDNNIEIFNGVNFPYSLLYGQNSNKLNIGSVIVGDISNKKIAIGDVSSANLNPNATLEILPKASSDKGLVVKSKSGHSANLFELQDSSSVNLFSVNQSGTVVISNPSGAQSLLIQAPSGRNSPTNPIMSIRSQTNSGVGTTIFSVYEETTGGDNGYVTFDFGPSAADGVGNKRDTKIVLRGENTGSGLTITQGAGGASRTDISTVGNVFLSFPNISLNTSTTIWTRNSNHKVVFENDTNSFSFVGGTSTGPVYLQINSNASAATSGHLLISPRFDKVGLVISSTGNNTANSFEVRDSGNVVKFSISPSGFVSGVNGYLSGGLNLNNSTLLNSNINNYSETIVPVSIVNSGLSLNLSSGNVFSCLLNSNITGVSVLNPRSSGTMHSFSLSLDYIDSGRSIIWPSNVYWNGGSGYAPILSSGVGRSAMISFSTSNGGSTYLGYVGGMNFGA